MADAERSGIALNCGDSGWPVASAAEDMPHKDGTGEDVIAAKPTKVENGVVTATEAWVHVHTGQGQAGADFTITTAGVATAAIDRQATGAQIQTAMEATANIAPGDVAVTGPAGGPWNIEFLEAGAFGDLNPAVSGVAAVSEVQTVTITGTPTGGSFRLGVRIPGGGVEETGNIAYNAAAAAVDTALEGLPSIGAGDVTCAGGALPGTPVTVTFSGALAGTDPAQIIVTDDSLTGGTTPAVAVTTTTPGGLNLTVTKEAAGS